MVFKVRLKYILITILLLNSPVVVEVVAEEVNIGLLARHVGSLNSTGKYSGRVRKKDSKFHEHWNWQRTWSVLRAQANQLLDRLLLIAETGDPYYGYERPGRKGRAESSSDEEPTQFEMSEVKVPPGFLRTEFMIAYMFMGVMYGFGFLVLFQAILVPVVKGLIGLLYLWALYVGAIDPVTVQDAVQQLPPQ
jgi:hypothetical protein